MTTSADRIEAAAQLLHERRHRAGTAQVCGVCRDDVAAVDRVLGHELEEAMPERTTEIPQDGRERLVYISPDGTWHEPAEADVNLPRREAAVLLALLQLAAERRQSRDFQTATGLLALMRPPTASAEDD